MKKVIKVTIYTVLTTSLLIACSNNDEENETPVQEPNNEENNIDSEDDNNESVINDDSDEEGSTDGLPDKNDFNSDDEQSGDDSGPNLGEGSTEDQLDLRIGDTGKIETSLDLFEVTLNSIEFEESINGETPERENFIIANITLKNLSEEKMDIEDALGVLEITGGLDIAGGSDYSHYYNAIEPMTGELESGQEKEGQLLFEENNFDEYYIRVTEGLIAAGGAKNQTIWTFTESESK